MRTSPDPVPKAFFVGAGISANPPTGFPMAMEVVARLLGAVSPDPSTLVDLIGEREPNGTSKSGSRDYVRFELLLDTVQSVVDPDLELLDFVDLYREPNALHVLLAREQLKET